MEGQMGGSPKALVQHLAGETSLLGTTGVQPWLPGPSDVESDCDIKSGEAVERRQVERSSDGRYIFCTVSRTTS